MSGIASIVIRNGLSPHGTALIEAMSAVLRHRGPDGESYNFDGNAGLGCRRLGIIDLADGVRPIRNGSRSAGVVFNGEIYNAVNILTSLKR